MYINIFKFICMCALQHVMSGQFFQIPVFIVTSTVLDTQQLSVMGKFLMWTLSIHWYNQFMRSSCTQVVIFSTEFHLVKQIIMGRGKKTTLECVALSSHFLWKIVLAIQMGWITKKVCFLFHSAQCTFLVVSLVWFWTMCWRISPPAVRPSSRWIFVRALVLEFAASGSKNAVYPGTPAMLMTVCLPPSALHAPVRTCHFKSLF